MVGPPPAGRGGRRRLTVLVTALAILGSWAVEPGAASPVGAAGAPASETDGPEVAPVIAPPAQRTVGEAPPGWPTPPRVHATSAIVVDVASGQVLAAIDPDRPRLVASTIKVLTALSVLERTELDDEVTVGDEVAGLPPYAAEVGLRPGHRWTVEQLLAGLIARSGNDAALALAVHVGGSVEGFVEILRQDAAALGIDGSGLRTPTGLGDRDQMSARDLAVIARVALQHPALAEIASQPTVDLPRIGRIVSRNELLAAYVGADGLKTGYTIAAGRCLIASATRDGRQVAVVVLGSTDPLGHFDDARALLDHVFDSFSTVRVTGSDGDLELREAGGWVPMVGDELDLFVPDDGPPVEHRLELPVEVPTQPVDAAVAWDGHLLADVSLEPPGGRAPDGSSGRDAVSSAPDVGAWIADRTYAAMRAASAADAWPVGEQRTVSGAGG
jgi:D-alanyl-D-alanine carboxypeptidase